MVTTVTGQPCARSCWLLPRWRSACLGRHLAAPRAGRARGWRWTQATPSSGGGGVPTVPVVVDALLSPDPDAARALRTEPRELLEDGRDVALELRRLVHGDLRGMFDGPTTPGLDLSAPLVVLDLSALYSSAALGVHMACATAWLQAALTRTAAASARHRHGPGVPGGRRGLGHPLQPRRGPLAPGVVEDVARLRGLQRGHRAPGVGSASGRCLRLRTSGAGTRTPRRTPRRVSSTRSRPASSRRWPSWTCCRSTEVELLPQLRRGVALWKVGQGSFLVQHRLSPMERLLVNTDGAMAVGVARRMADV